MIVCVDDCDVCCVCGCCGGWVGWFYWVDGVVCCDDVWCVLVLYVIVVCGGVWCVDFWVGGFCGVYCCCVV